MAVKTRIVVQQITTSDANDVSVGKYPRYIINLGNSITSITADELASAVGSAKDSANKAAASAAAAKTSEQAAAASATGASSAKTAAETAAAGAKASETAASTSAASAKTQADRAKTEADNSAASATQSAFSEANAKTAENNAKEAQRLAEVARDAAAASSATSTSEANRAKTEADRSKTEADKSAASAAAAKVSETNAAGSATGAAGSKDEAATEADRAKTEADRAEAAAESVVQPEDLAGFVKTYKTYAEAVADLPKRFAGETVLIWNEGSAKYQWYETFDNSGSLELQLSSEENKMMSVNNIRPDTNGNVQVTIPGGNPSLWLGEVTWFPYDKDNTVGYSGVLLGDGRELRRVDYPDVWTSIETGLIPSVTEAEWQAGSNMFFSKGNGTTTFRLPNLLQGQAFRAANAGEDGTEKVTAQVPYITMVNGIEPGADGKVVIGSDSIEGTIPISKGGTGAVTDSAARTNLKLDKFVQIPASTNVYFPTKSAALVLRDSDLTWGVYNDSTTSWAPLGIGQGGTGARDAAGVRTNIGVERFQQFGAETNFISPNGTYKLLMDNNGQWGGYDAVGGTGWKALGLAQGGTAGKNAEEARKNLDVPRASRSAITGNLNTWYGAEAVGFYPQPSSANATAANNYPETSAGTLSIMFSGANGANEATQMYYPYNQDHFWKRRLAPSGSGVTASTWKKFSADDDIWAGVDLRFSNFGINTTGVIEANNANDLQRNGFFAGAGASGTNYQRPYAPGLVLRRVNDVYQVQWDDVGRMYARAYTGGAWGTWNASVLVGDYGVGTTQNIPPASEAASFIGDSNGATTWAASNGAGFQASYANNRNFQMIIGTNSVAYVRYNDSGNATVSKTTKPWTTLQSAGTSDINFKKLYGDLDVEVSLENINKLEFKMFKYLDDDYDREIRRGIIAQQAELVDKEYVHAASVSGAMTLDTNPLLMDSMAAIKALTLRDEANKAEIDGLKSEIQELKTLIQALLPKTEEGTGEVTE